MIELIGYIWVGLAGVIAFGSLRATYLEWGYNTTTTPGDDMDKKQRKEQLRVLKAIAGLDRKTHFANGGDLVSWRGGTRTVTVDRRKQRDKRACRGKKWRERS